MKTSLSALLLALCFLASPATAASVIHDFRGSFTGLDGGTFSGWIESDATTGRVLGGRADLTSGRSSDDVDDVDASSYVFSSQANATLTFDQTTPGAERSRFVLELSPDLAAANPGIARAIQSYCRNADCTRTESIRLAQSGVITVRPAQATPVPTLSEWAIILFGAVLTGGAALILYRRRSMA